MLRLTDAQQRLFLPTVAARPYPDAANQAHGNTPPGQSQSVSERHECAPGLVDAQGRVRAMVLELARPADWPALAAVWRGVQTDLGWPAPAIAVSGSDAYQLWFSLHEPVPMAQAHGVLAGLCARYLAEVAPKRLRLSPSSDLVMQVKHLPPAEVQPGQWSAFVAPDLAPVFADEPWIDLSPNPEGQAELLSRLRPIGPEAWAQAVSQAVASPADLATAASVPPAEPGDGAALTTAPQDTLAPVQAPLAAHTDPRQFLLEVMNHPALPLALRIDAAKALLPWHSGAQQPAVHLPAASNSMVMPDSGT